MKITDTYEGGVVTSKGLKIEADEVIDLVSNAEIGSKINVQNAEQDLKEAQLAISKFSENEKNPEKIKALKEISKAEARIQAAKN